KTTAGVSNRAPTTRPSTRPTSGITASKSANVNAGRNGRIPRRPNASATASVSNPSGTTKTAILRSIERATPAFALRRFAAHIHLAQMTSPPSLDGGDDRNEASTLAGQAVLDFRRDLPVHIM